MKKVFYTLTLILVTLVQITWAPLLSFQGFVLPVVLLTLLLSTFFRGVIEVLIFSFGIGIFLNLIGGGLLGSESLSLVLALTIAYAIRNLFLKQKWIGFLIATLSAVLVYEGVLRLVSSL